jgi:hypothetical protein
VNGITPLINTHSTIGTHLANEMLPIDLLQPSVRGNERGKRTQAWKRGKGHTRGLVARGVGLVGSLHSVMSQEGLRDRTYEALGFVDDRPVDTPGCRCGGSVRQTHFCQVDEQDTHSVGFPSKAETATLGEGKSPPVAAPTKRGSRSKVIL